ncbi:MAG: endonuclease domain-containing protein [Candidatus Margulisiibacteriota bacterium]|nr:endonuclease domain-containing protein [Candidatus Margulisiibacteriota bacterium]
MKRAKLKIVRYLRKNETAAEILLWQELRNKNLGIKSRRQYPIERFILDFYAPQIKLGIEVDGGIHYKRNIQLYDMARQKYLEELGIKILRFKNEEVAFEIDGVINKIKKCVTPFPSP